MSLIFITLLILEDFKEINMFKIKVDLFWLYLVSKI